MTLTAQEVKDDAKGERVPIEVVASEEARISTTTDDSIF